MAVIRYSEADVSPNAQLDKNVVGYHNLLTVEHSSLFLFLQKNFISLIHLIFYHFYHIMLNLTSGQKTFSATPV